MFELFTELGWVQSIALSSVFIAVIWASGYLINEACKQRHERQLKEIKLQYELDLEIMSEPELYAVESGRTE